MTIGILPDDVLLEIFSFYMYEAYEDEWHTLVHVCQQWRYVAFASPRRLHLQLICTPTRSVREMIDIWPELPIIILDYGEATAEGGDNVISVLELNDRIHGIKFWHASSSELERLAAAMQDPFPALTDLQLVSSDEMAPVIPDSFLGGSAPRLQRLWLDYIPFPALPNLLLSATDLVDLYLWNIPHSGYISPQAMVTCLSVLTRLKELALQFQSPESHPSRASRRPPPLTRTILPALIHLCFRGVTEYLEDLVAQIDVPLLAEIDISFFNQLVFRISQLPEFLYRTERLKRLDHADMVFHANFIDITLSSQTGTADPAKLKLGISCRTLDWQLSSLAQVCDLCLPTLSTWERLRIREAYSSLRHWEDEIENAQWHELLQPFTTIKNLHLSKEVASHVAPALQELARDRTTEVLPALQVLSYDGFQGSGPIQEALQEFIAARQLSGHPVIIHRLEEGKAVGNQSGGR